MKAVLACFFLLGLAVVPTSAQTLVRLEVESESWLGAPPFDIRGEVTKRLGEASIEITDAPDAPLVRLSYEESPAVGYSPRLVPATSIRFETLVRSGGLDTWGGWSISAPLRADNTEFPSAAELRLRSVEAFKRDTKFLLLGHYIGAALGIATSFRKLLAEDEAGQFPWVQMLLFSKLRWSVADDDLFERVLAHLPSVSTSPSDKLVRDKMVRDQSQYFLKQNLMDLQGSASPSIRAAILAIYQLGEYGDRSSIQMLNDLMVNPQLAASAYTALRKIDARANAVTP